jgi:hypothetical protein
VSGLRQIGCLRRLQTYRRAALVHPGDRGCELAGLPESQAAGLLDGLQIGKILKLGSQRFQYLQALGEELVPDAPKG